MELKEWAALTISVIALIVSIISSRQNVATSKQIAKDSAEHQRRMARRATYQRIHETLVEPRAATGRRLLFQAARRGKFRG